MQQWCISTIIKVIDGEGERTTKWMRRMRDENKKSCSRGGRREIYRVKCFCLWLCLSAGIWVCILTPTPASPLPHTLVKISTPSPFPLPFTFPSFLFPPCWPLQHYCNYTFRDHVHLSGDDFTNNPLITVPNNPRLLTPSPGGWSFSCSTCHNLLSPVISPAPPPLLTGKLCKPRQAII